MARAADEIFNDDAFARLYDHFNPWSAGDDFYFALARETGGPILDLGRGTGMLACSIAGEVSPAIGVDPAVGMLRVARSRPGAERVEWIESGAQNLRLPRRFNLIYLTGHSFQVFLTDEDILTVLRTAACHLASNGRMAFETRNPAAEAWRSWTPEMSRTIVETGEHGRVEESCDTNFDRATGIAQLTHRYRFLDKGVERVGQSRLRFIAQGHLADLIAAAGLSPLAWYVNWDRSPYSPEAKEIIAALGAT